MSTKSRDGMELKPNCCLLLDGREASGQGYIMSQSYDKTQEF
jgi:hypothetical protein